MREADRDTGTHEHSNPRSASYRSTKFISLAPGQMIICAKDNFYDTGWERGKEK